MTAIMAQYNMKLQRIVRSVKRDIDATLLPAIRAQASNYVLDSQGVVMDGWADSINTILETLIGRWSAVRALFSPNDIAQSFVQSALKKSERDMKKRTGIDVFSGDAKMREYLVASAIQNATLIKSIPAQYLAQVSTIVMTNMRAGMRPSYIEKALHEQFGVTQRRARVIARDQTAKIQGDLAEKQQRNAGFSYFKWLDSSDSKVRDWHHKLANKLTAYGLGVYRWDDLPLSEKGQPIKPGQDYLCRCTAIPVSDKKVAENQQKGLVDKGVLR